MVFAVMFVYHGFAQQIKFKRVYGSGGYEFGYSAVQTLDTGYAIAGVTSSYGYGNMDVYLVKTDSMGLPKWFRVYGGINVDRGLCVRQTLDTGYVIAGYTNSIGVSGYNMYLIKTNKLGDTLWTRTYGGSDWDFANAVEQTSDGGYILCGSTYSYGKGDKDVYLIKTNASGDTLWTKTYGGVDEDEAFSVKQTSDGGYILAGYTNSFGAGSSDVYYIRTNATGDTLWTKTLGGTGADRGNSVLQATDGGFVIAGYKFDATLSINQAYIVKTNSSGSPIWQKEFGTPNDAAANAVIEANDGGYVWAGKLNLGGQYDVYFFKLDINGDFAFATTYGTSGEDEAFFTWPTKDNGFIVGGTTNGIGYGLNDVFFVKTDTSGLSVSAITVGIEGAGDKSIPLTRVFPNPASDRVFVQMGKISPMVQQAVELFDFTGKAVECVVTFHSTGTAEIHTGELSPGIYFLQLSTEYGVSRQKLIIQH